MQHISEPRFPFSAIVAQERMKRALLLNAVNPRIGGALIRGNKGTAKSTAVRALAGVLHQLMSSRVARIHAIPLTSWRPVSTVRNRISLLMLSNVAFAS